MSCYRLSNVSRTTIAIRARTTPSFHNCSRKVLVVKQQQEEDQRVQELMTSRSAKRKLQRALDAETLQGRRLFKMLPDAFVFNYAGGDGNLVKLSFRLLLLGLSMSRTAGTPLIVPRLVPGSRSRPMRSG